MKRIVFFIVCFLVIILSIPTSSVFAIQKSSISGLGAKKKVHAELIMPDGQGPFPGVLILHTSGGVQKYDIEYAEQLAKEGYACLVPYYFDTYGISYNSRDSATTVYADDILADFIAEVEYLKAQPKISKDKTGAVGFSMGGYWALILAGTNKVQVGVSYYGAITGGAKFSDLKYRFDDIFTKDSCPVLILHGRYDSTIKVKSIEHLGDMLKERMCVYELYIYPNAEHRFERGKSLDAHAASDSWSRTLSFLRKYLK